MKDQIQIKWGLGWIPSMKRPIKLYHVVVNGHTMASFRSAVDASRYAQEWTEQHPQSRHDVQQ